MFRIFNKERVAKELFNVNLDAAELQAACGGNVFIDHPELDKNLCCVVEQEYEFQYPTYDELEDTIREMSLYERYKNNLYQLAENEVELNNDIRSLMPGEYLDLNGFIQTKPKPNGCRIEWNYRTQAWEEKATVEEIAEFYKNNINQFKAEILEVGFDYKGHQQKCREKDLALLGNAIAANEDAATYAKTPVTHWSFNDGDVVEITVDELRTLRVDGATFVQTIFTVEAILKASKPNAAFTKEDFIKQVNANSVVKCYEPKKLV